MDAKKRVSIVSSALSHSDRILILFWMILFIVVTGCTSVSEKPQLSKDQIIIAAGEQKEIHNLAGNHTFRIADAKTGASLADSNSGKKPAQEVWLVPLSVCHEGFEYIYTIEMTRDGKLYAVSDRPAHVTYPPPELRTNSSDPCLQEGYPPGNGRNITKEEAVQIVLRDPAVIHWINNSMNNTECEVQDVHRETFSAVGKPGVPPEDRWVVPLYMYINNITYHYTIEVGMNGTIMYWRYPRTLYPPPPDWTPAP